MSKTFDYVAYDEIAHAKQARCKAAAIEMEASIAAIAADPSGFDQSSARERALAQTELQIVYARCGRAIRDDQIARNGSAKLQEARGAE